MAIKLHIKATTAPKFRTELQASPASINNSKLARQHGVGDSTIRRQEYCNDADDRSHIRNNLQATLTTVQKEKC